MNLKETRISKGLNQENAAKILGVPLRTYKRYETETKYQNSFKYQQFINLLNEINKTRNSKSYKSSLHITVAGIGYVGLSLATLLSFDNDVTITDIVDEKIKLVNKKKSPFIDDDISRYLEKKELSLKAIHSDEEAYRNSDVVIIATPTDFDPNTGSFNTESVASVIDMVNSVNKKALVVIKSTVPIGFTQSMREKYQKLEIIFSPEFLREGKALHDNLYPSRIIIGAERVTNKVKQFASLLESHARNFNKAMFMSSKEAEAVKLFSNAYLAMRVAYFNELDSYAKNKGLDSEQIIKGVSRDSRIGDYYNNPSFGYGGYCLPKDSEQLQNSFVDIPNNNIIKAIVESNQTRKEFIANDVIEEAQRKSGKDIKDITIGIYSLAMKAGSDNYRSSSSVDIMNLLTQRGINVIIYDKKYDNSVKSLDEFKDKADLIITNRFSEELNAVKEKLYTRDIYSRD